MTVDWERAPDDVMAEYRRSRSLKSQGHWTARQPAPALLDSWPAEWRDLATDWARSCKGDSSTWLHWLKLAGSGRRHLADAVLLGLIRGGFIGAEVCRTGTTNLHTPRKLHWLDRPGLCRRLGLADPADRRDAAMQALSTPPAAPTLQALFLSLAGMPADQIIRRHQLIVALDAWLANRQKGTFRDLAQQARGHTKQLSASERDWLAAFLDLRSIGLEAHQPMYWLGGSSMLVGEQASRLPLAGLHGGFIALSRRALDGLTGISQCHRVTLIENRTSFERHAESCLPDEMVIWLPGYVGQTWLDGLRQLLLLASAPCWIAADCDPWGVEIAMQVGQLCQQLGLDWRPLHMDTATLADCRHILPLTQHDQARLDKLLASTILPAGLRDICQGMRERGIKAEQEQYL